MRCSDVDEGPNLGYTEARCGPEHRQCAALLDLTRKNIKQGTISDRIPDHEFWKAADARTVPHELDHRIDHTRREANWREEVRRGLERPRDDPTGRGFLPNADMLEKVLRNRRHAASLQVARRGSQMPIDRSENPA